MSASRPSRSVPLRYILIPLFVAMVTGLLALLYYVLSQSGQLAGFSPGVNLQPTLIRQDNRPAPDFTLTLSDGRVVRLSDFRGQPVVINFWASWCAPCRAEAPTLEEAQKRYAERGVVIIGINLWDTEEAAAEFRKVYGQTYPSGPDPRGKIAIEYGVSGIPETFSSRRMARSPPSSSGRCQSKPWRRCWRKCWQTSSLSYALARLVPGNW